MDATTEILDLPQGKVTVSRKGSGQQLLLLHGGGFFLGWLIPALLGQPQPVRRTVSIEVGMQNSGLAVVLARSGFAASPLTALPGAISAVVHAVLGSVLATVWRLVRTR